MSCIHEISWLGTIWDDKTGERLGCGYLDFTCECKHSLMRCIFGTGMLLCPDYERGESQCKFPISDPEQDAKQTERCLAATKKRMKLS